MQVDVAALLAESAFPARLGDRVLEGVLMASDHSVPGLPRRTPAGDRFTYDEAVLQLADAMENLPTYVTPQTASALQATENLWRRVEVDGLLTSSEVNILLGLDPTSGAIVTGLRHTKQIIGVKRRNRIRYPAVQFSRESRNVRPVIPALIAIAAENDYSQTDLLLWMFTETTYFDDERRPIDHLEQTEELLDVARNSMGIQW